VIILTKIFNVYIWFIFTGVLMDTMLQSLYLMYIFGLYLQVF